MGIDWLDGFLDRAIGNAAKAVIPKCGCGADALPLQCIVCRRHACALHLWVNAAKMKALCSECASEAFEEIEEVSAQTTELTCWDVLGISSEGATKAAINKAYRRVSIVCHPDRATDEEDRAEREEMFKELGEAREAALQEIGEK